MRHKFISLADVVNVLIELTGVARTKQAVYFWMKKGRISSDGRMVKLKCKKRLGRLYTTREWIEEFCKEVG